MESGREPLPLHVNVMAVVFLQADGTQEACGEAAVSSQLSLFGCYHRADQQDHPSEAHQGPAEDC